MAESLAEWRLDAVSIACGLLHDTVEDTLMTNEEVRRQFGEETAEIVDGLTKMSKLDFTDRTLLNAENVRKLLVAMGKDVRVLLVKLADRLHNMRTLASMREEKRRRIAHETLELYAPLANRLGMGTVRAELEDLAFANLEPERYAEMRHIVELKRSKSAPMMEEIKTTLQSALRAQGIEAEIYSTGSSTCTASGRRWASRRRAWRTSTTGWPTGSSARTGPPATPPWAWCTPSTSPSRGGSRTTSACPRTTATRASTPAC